MIELLVVIVIIVIVLAMAIPQIRSTMRESRVRQAYEDVLSSMRRAHEVAIDRRRVVALTFNPGVGINPATIQFNQEIFTPGVGGNPGTYSTAPPVSGANPSTITLPSDMNFLLPSGVTALPEAFSNQPPGSPTDFGYSPRAAGAGQKVMYFQADGTVLRDSEQGAVASGAIYVGRQGDQNSFRAISILGQTGRIKGWRFVSSTWQEYK